MNEADADINEGCIPFTYTEQMRSMTFGWRTPKRHRPPCGGTEGDNRIDRTGSGGADQQWLAFAGLTSSTQCRNSELEDTAWFQAAALKRLFVVAPMSCQLNGWQPYTK